MRKDVTESQHVLTHALNCGHRSGFDCSKETLRISAFTAPCTTPAYARQFYAALLLHRCSWTQDGRHMTLRVTAVAPRNILW
jgi:hypothetical protein